MTTFNTPKTITQVEEQHHPPALIGQCLTTGRTKVGLIVRCEMHRMLRTLLPCRLRRAGPNYTFNTYSNLDSARNTGPKISELFTLRREWALGKLGASPAKGAAGGGVTS